MIAHSKNERWLSKLKEEALEPDLPICDPHHHLWERGGQRYMIDEMAADMASGHNIVATVYVDCRSMYRANGPEAFRPVGEVEFANGVAAMSASGGYGKGAMCAGIVSHVTRQATTQHSAMQQRRGQQDHFSSVDVPARPYRDRTSIVSRIEQDKTGERKRGSCCPRRSRIR